MEGHQIQVKPIQAGLGRSGENDGVSMLKASGLLVTSACKTLDIQVSINFSVTCPYVIPLSGAQTGPASGGMPQKSAGRGRV